jgi:hypothetical protein
MEKKFESLTIFEFQDRFPDDKACMDYLSKLKWEEKYLYPKCKHTHYCAGGNDYNRECTKCRYVESPTSGTLFHQLKFSLLKAFYIVYHVITNKKGISSRELSRKLGLRQKTCWLFKQKVMRAMKSKQKHKLMGQVEVDETVVGGQEEDVRGRQNNKKKLVVVAVERKGKGISRFYGKVIEQSNAKEFVLFMKTNIDTEACIKTDQWKGYHPLKKVFKNLNQVPSGKKGENFPDLHRIIMNFKGWLRGMHHHAELLQAYIDEYTYRFNRNSMKGNIFENLMIRMVKAKHCPYKMIIS